MQCKTFNISNTMKAHSIIIDHEYLKGAWFTEPFVAHLFSYLMVIAGHCGFRFDGMDVETGTVLTSFKTISEETGMSVARVRKCLARLSELGEVAVGRRKNLQVITVFRIEASAMVLEAAEKQGNRVHQPEPQDFQQPQQQLPQPQQPTPQPQQPRPVADPQAEARPAFKEKSATAGYGYPGGYPYYSAPEPCLNRQQRRQAAREQAKAARRLS